MIGQAEGLLKLKHLLNEDEKAFSNVISITSGKGGTGKSFIALNVSWVLANKGIKVLLIDMNANNANLHLMVNVIPETTLDNYLAGQKLFKDCITPLKPNLDIIFGAIENNGNRVAQSVKNGMSLVINDYDVVILDMGPGNNGYDQQIIPFCRANIIITTPEPTAVMDAYAVLKMLKTQGYSGENYLVVNKCTDKQDGTVTFKNLFKAAEHFLKTKLKFMAEISFDQIIMSCVKSQDLLVAKYPLHNASKELESLAMAVYKTVGHY